MKYQDCDNSTAIADSAQPSDDLAAPKAWRGSARELPESPNYNGVVIGTLLGLADEGRTPLVGLPHPTLSAALRARSILDLSAAHIGHHVVLLFEQGEPSRPVIMGLLHNCGSSAATTQLGHVEVSLDGERMIVSARSELVLRCGKSRLTLREDGRIEISGETIVTKATGANRILGGSVELN